jgi:hypothetical protein
MLCKSEQVPVRDFKTGHAPTQQLVRVRDFRCVMCINIKITPHKGFKTVNTTSPLSRPDYCTSGKRPSWAVRLRGLAGCADVGFLWLIGASSPGIGEAGPSSSSPAEDSGGAPKPYDAMEGLLLKPARPMIWCTLGFCAESWDGDRRASCPRVPLRLAASRRT